MPAQWTHRALLTPFSRYVALAVMLVSFIFPVGGLGVDLCWLHAATGLPCPGCGMSRAVAAVSQGDFVVALGANPFVVFVWPLFVLLAVLALMPKTWVTSIEARLDLVGPQLARGYRVVLFAFLGFGVLRFSWFLVMGQPFP
jgi:hypothetical protein